MTRTTAANDASLTSPWQETPPQQEEVTERFYANRHIPKFLALMESTESSKDVVQVVTNGRELTARNLIQGKLSIAHPILVKDSPTSIGMTLPTPPNGDNVSVRDIADIIGHAHPVSVIDVQHQEELEGWTMGDLVEYFEDEDRLGHATTRQQHSSTTTNRRRRAAATQAIQKNLNQSMPKVLNQISLEFSRTPLEKFVKSPQFVRDLDWINHAWPSSRRVEGDYPVVQYYCLTSTAGCYTDFHVDFGGTAVWYHVLRGEKQFVLVPPTKSNLATYESWLCRSNQAQLFFVELLEDPNDVVSITLQEGQTMVIPTGWIHGVYTPKDSIVMGGNFLHSLQIQLQLDIYSLEIRTRVPGRFRFPHYLALQFYAGGMFLTKLKRNVRLCKEELQGLEFLVHALEEWWKLQADPTIAVAAQYAASTNDCQSVEEFLTLLKLERARHVVMAKNNARTSSSSDEEEQPKKFRLKLAACSTTKPDGNPPSQVVQSDQPSSVVSSNTTAAPRLKLSPPREKKASPTTNNTNQFRIKLSPENQQPPDPSPSLLSSSSSRKKKQREGLEEYIPSALDGDLDEWEPDTRKRKRPSVSSKKATLPRTSVGAKPTKIQPTKPKSTVRQRLMKRFR